MGLTLYAILLREVYWFVHTSFTSLPSFIWGKTEEIADQESSFEGPRLLDFRELTDAGVREVEWIMEYVKNRLPDAPLTSATANQ
jgi:hypothetical protein